MLTVLTDKLSSYLDEKQVAKVERAYIYSEKCHLGQMRQSGDPYITHPLAVANILADMQMDHESLMAALLHDVIEDTGATKGQLSRRFGRTVADLVDGVSKLTEIEFETKAEQQAESFQKMTLAMSRDIRVVLVKLADRLHNMRTLGGLAPEKRRRVARETLDIYAPIAQRLGINDIRIEFEDLGFAAMYPLRHRRLREAMKAARKNRKEIVAEIHQAIELRLERESFDAVVKGREKHLWSIYLKMREKKKSFRDIMDVFAFRLVVDNVDDCYRTLGIMHNIFKPVPGEFKDYIAIPKANGYQSLHTVLVGMHGVLIEVQIRTREMHRVNEFGFAAHWAYKQDERPDGQVGWLRDLIEIVDASHDPEELLEHTRLAIYQDRIFAFTPKGALFQLPKGATPVDFAFAVHTDLGAQPVGAKINGRHMPLRTQLNNGDVVEIIKSDNADPQLSWLGFVVTGKARASIRRAVRLKERAEVAEIGQKLFDEIALRVPAKVGKKALREALKRLEMEEEEDLFYAIGAAKIEDRAVMEALVPGCTAELENEPDWAKSGKALSIRGLTPGVGFQLAECCHPVPGDRIVGLRKPGEGVEVHTIDCNHLASGIDSDWLDLSWGKRSRGAVGRLRVTLYDRPGTLAEMAGIFAQNHVNVTSLEQTQLDHPFTTYEIDLEVQDVPHLTRILSALRASDSIAQAERV